jgi:hypothetical protein
MAKFTKKWLKEFDKRYSDTIKSLQELENEYNEMVETNPDNYWDLNYLMPKECVVNFDKTKGSPTIFHYESSEEHSENVEVQIGSGVGFFYFKFKDYKDLIQFRNDLIGAIDKFNRPVEETKEFITDDCEDEEGWEDNEEQEYTIQCSRTAVQTWTHTVMARSTCEAYRKAQEGEGHDENDDFDQYGDIDYESI